MTTNRHGDEAPRLRVIQNCFLPNQQANCSFESYLNHHTPTSGERYLFFETDVMARLVSEGWHRYSDYFGVLSHRFQRKLMETQTWPLPLKNLNRETITCEAVESFLETKPEADLVYLARHIPHAVFQLGESIHPGLMAATKRMLECIGINFDLSLRARCPIYFNSFVARSKFLERYVMDLLEPAMLAATEDSTLRTMLFTDSGYFKSFPAELAAFYGINHYPLHAFIGERLINVYVMLSAARVQPILRGNPNNLRGRALEALRIKARLLQWKLAPLERRLRPPQPLRPHERHD